MMKHIAIAYGMGITAENVAKHWEITREQQDEFAAESHKKAVAAQERGDFKAEISPMEITVRQADLQASTVLVKKKLISEDEGPRADTSYEAIAKLKPVFAAQGYGNCRKQFSNQ